MIVTTSGGAHSCVAAEQYLDGVHLLDADGKIKLIITDPNDVKDVQGGEIVVVEQPEMPSTEDSVYDELDAAYQAGYEEGYTEGVNSAYDQ